MGGRLMLGVSGCRGVVGDGLTPEVALRFAGAFGEWLRGRGSGATRVVVARDGRRGGDVFHGAAVSGLRGVGCEVIDLGVEMTPTAGVMVSEMEAAGGMVLTASHNGQEWNGLKCLVRGGDGAASAPTASEAGEIVACYEAGVRWGCSWRELGMVRPHRDAGWEHVSRVLARFGTDMRRAIEEHGWTVVLDSVNASGVGAGRRLLEQLGCRVVHLGAEEGGVFWHTPEPTRENLTGLCAAVREHRAAVGFAQDPDGDRLALVDEHGAYVGEEYTLAIAAREVLEMCARGRERASPVVCTNLSTSRMIDDVAREYGVRVVRTAVGEANVVEAMRRGGAAVGGEGNGGVVWAGVTYVRDSLGAMALTLAAMARGGRGLRALAESIPAYAIEKRKVEVASREAAGGAGEAVAAWGARTGGRVDRQDGVRVDWDASPAPGGGAAWVHVRASNTEPIMRLIGEARREEGARALLDMARRAIDGV